MAGRRTRLDLLRERLTGFETGDRAEVGRAYSSGPGHWVEAERVDGPGRLNGVLILGFIVVVIGAFCAAAWVFVRVEYSATWVASLVRTGAALLVVVPIVAGVAWLVHVVRHDGVYSGVQCSSRTLAKKVEIGPEGFLARGCVLTYGKITFVNRTEETSFELCVGRNGDCFRDEVVPRELRGRLAVEPGAMRVWTFPMRWVASIDLSRNYPVTLSGVADVAAPDLVVGRTYEPSSS